MKQFFDKDFWKNTVGCTVGTLIGILLTFGTSSYLENRNKTEMARKTVMLTLHNLDASTRNMQTLLDELQQYDTLFTRAASLMPDRLGQMGSDSLQMVRQCIRLTPVADDGPYHKQHFLQQFRSVAMSGRRKGNRTDRQLL